MEDELSVEAWTSCEEKHDFEGITCSQVAKKIYKDLVEGREVTSVSVQVGSDCRFIPLTLGEELQPVASQAAHIEQQVEHLTRQLRNMTDPPEDAKALSTA